jgi:hypothetical protein
MTVGFAGLYKVCIGSILTIESDIGLGLYISFDFRHDQELLMVVFLRSVSLVS